MAIERLFINEGIKEAEVKKFLAQELRRAGLAGIEIQRTPLVTRIIINCDRPALVIGRKGRNVKEITRVIEERYKLEKPELEIRKIGDPNLEPDIVAYRIASALERGMNPRKVGYKALQAIMDTGAKGAEIVMSGKLVGKGGRARTLKMNAGYMKKCGEPSFTQVARGYIVAQCKPGVIGISIRIVPQGVHFPDEIDVIMPEEFEVEEEVIEETAKEKDARKEKLEKKEMPKEKKDAVSKEKPVLEKKVEAPEKGDAKKEKPKKAMEEKKEPPKEEKEETKKPEEEPKKEAPKQAKKKTEDKKESKETVVTKKPKKSEEKKYGDFEE